MRFLASIIHKVRDLIAGRPAKPISNGWETLQRVFQLEEKFDAAIRETGLANANIERTWDLLARMKSFEINTYEHSLRVGLKAHELAKHIPSLDPKALIMPAALHDIGKIRIPLHIVKKAFDKSKEFMLEDMQLMKKHPLHSHCILAEAGLLFTSEVALRHHYFQENGYPEELPPLHAKFSHKTDLLAIELNARLVALLDFYDAVTFRHNGKFANGKPLTLEKIHDIILENNPDQKRLIEDLYSHHIFGDDLRIGKAPAFKEIDLTPEEP